MDKPPSPSHAAASIAMRVLRAVLEDSAKNGKVSMADIDRSIALIERGTVELDQAYAAARQRFEAEEQDKKSTEDDASASPQKRFWMRSDPLHRLLVRPSSRCSSPTPRPSAASICPLISMRRVSSSVPTW
jgi:hypothetical protein